MSTYWLITAIQKATSIEAIELVEMWINEEVNNRFTPMLADMALIKKCELIAARYPVE